eukprot:390504-Ditylum_brightwellii.AAC.1
MPEINTPWTKEVQQRCHTYGRTILGSFRKVGVSSNETSSSLYQPGGVAIFCKGRMTGRINKMGSDEKGLGRWCYIRLSGKYNKHIWIIATYRVCNQGSEGLETAYMQQ